MVRRRRAALCLFALLGVLGPPGGVLANEAAPPSERSAPSMVLTRVLTSPSGLAYDTYEAGGGVGFEDFWPASSVKPVVAVAALRYLADLGFTGAAEVAFDDAGWSATVADLYDDALRWSSNEAYDDLLRIAGIDWLNENFLTPQNGFGRTVIERFYDGESTGYSPGMTLTEGERQTYVPERHSAGGFGCPSSGNCTSLGELADGLRRVVLDEELAPGERFGLDEADMVGLRNALLGAEGFMDAGIRDALGDDVLIYKKPGWWPGLDCVEEAVVSSPSTGQRFIMAAAVPDGTEGCEVLGRFAHAALAALKDLPAHSRLALSAQAEVGLVPATPGSPVIVDPEMTPGSGMRLVGAGLTMILLGTLWGALQRRSR